MAYQYTPFPKWIFHFTHEAKIVNTEQEYAEHVSSGWFDSPADAIQVEPVVELSIAVDKPYKTSKRTKKAE